MTVEFPFSSLSTRIILRSDGLSESVMGLLVFLIERVQSAVRAVMYNVVYDTVYNATYNTTYTLIVYNAKYNETFSVSTPQI